jgi:gas vesicle protein
VQVLSRDESGVLRVKTVGSEELERSRREMKTLLLERDLLSTALTRIYEAETDGRITREDREGIARRYSDQIRDMEGKLRDKELVVEVGELENLRDELVSLFSDKVQNIEARLDQAKERLRPARPDVTQEIAREQTAAVAPAEDLEKAVERKVPRRDESEGEKRTRELRDEVMEALAQLEQIDVKKENENT